MADGKIRLAPDRKSAYAVVIANASRSVGAIVSTTARALPAVPASRRRPPALSLASCISPRQSASCAAPGVDQGSKAASGFSAPKATELATRAVIGPTAGWTCGELKLPSTTIGPRRARETRALRLGIERQVVALASQNRCCLRPGFFRVGVDDQRLGDHAAVLGDEVRDDAADRRILVALQQQLRGAGEIQIGQYDRQLTRLAAPADQRRFAIAGGLSISAIELPVAMKWA